MLAERIRSDEGQILPVFYEPCVNERNTQGHGRQNHINEQEQTVIAASQAGLFAAADSRISGRHKQEHSQ